MLPEASSKIAAGGTFAELAAATPGSDLPPAAQDIVTASSDFNIDAFIPKLRQYLTVIQASKRQFLISWISVLASVPDIDMLAYLPHLLGGLMALLADPAQEIRQSAGKVLQVTSVPAIPE